MHRHILGSVAASLLLAPLAWAQSSTSADLILRGGEIVTVNDRQPEAEAVAIRSGVIAAVGNETAVMQLKGVNTTAVDLNGKTLVPGFIDAHGHSFNAGVQALADNLLATPDGDGKDIASLKAQLTSWGEGKTSRKLGWIIGFGYDDSKLSEQRHPSRDDRDTVSRDVPVLAIHQSGRLAVVKSMALEVAEVTARRLTACWRKPPSSACWAPCRNCRWPTGKPSPAPARISTCASDSHRPGGPLHAGGQRHLGRTGRAEGPCHRCGA